MKKMYFFLPCFFLIVSNLIAGITGAAEIEPAQLPNNSYSHTITVNFYPSNIMTWTNGKLQIDIPQQFPDAPNLTPTDNGYVEAIIMRGGTNPESINVSNILIENYTITINAITLGTGDFLKVIYGSKSAGGYGIGTPMMPGIYVFHVLESSTGGNPSMIEEQPSILISNLAISKSAGSSYVMASDELTYYITYSNLSSVHQLQNVYIWDTIPLQFNIIQILPAPVYQDGNFIVWNIGTIMYMMANTISINLSAKDGIIKDGQQIVNSVSAAGNDMYNNTYNVSASNVIDVYGVKLSIGINAMPSNVHTGQNITVIMQVTNNGNTKASYIGPDSFNFYGSGNANLLTEPVPYTVNELAPGGVTEFTWTYSATLTGEISFSGRAICYEGTAMKTVYSSFAQSNTINISYPATGTPTKTSTILPTTTSTFMMPTETQTHTPTYTGTNTPISPTDTPTSAPTNSFTATGTSTELQNFTETPTNTSTPTNTKTLHFTATETKTNMPFLTPTNTQTPVINIVLDKNYIDISKGEKVKITIKESKDKKVIIKIFTLTGDIVKKIEFITTHQGWNEIEWDAKNHAGKIVGRGIYFLYIWVEGGQEIRRVYVIK